MKTALIGSGNNIVIMPPTINDGSVDACCAWANYEIAVTLQHCNSAQLALSAVDMADISAAESTFAGLSVQLKTWLQDATSASIAGEQIPALEVNYIPELIQFAGLVLTGNWGGVFMLFVKVGLKFLIEYLTESLDSGNNVNETSQVLQEQLSAITNMLASGVVAREERIELDSVDYAASAMAYN